VTDTRAPSSRALDGPRVTRTIDRLCRRVEARFPGSGLFGVCDELLETATQAAATAAWIARPILSLRIAVAFLVVVILAGLLATLAAMWGPIEPLTLSELVQTLEAGINDVVLVAAAVFFLVTLESRVKRRRALKAIYELRSIAHVIDMHQLTKDPERLVGGGPDTGLVERSRMSRFELGRYLDYCSEALSLTGKVAALYIQGFDDPVALQAVNEVERLTTGLSRKVWQKLMVLHSLAGGARRS
jgi:uncharacterized membrane protein YtjA (UPF0391 family)